MKNKLVLILWLELQDSLMASGIKRTILDEMIMATDTLLLWSDSKAVSNYLRNTKANFRPCIVPRCNKSQVSMRVEDWRYISSEINIVNILSHGISFDKF